MPVRLYREYRLKFYLNASHFIIINGRRGEVHPHTWEFTLNIRFGRESFAEFNVFEKGIESFLRPFQNSVMNDHEPFDTITPTVENMVDVFSREFYRIIYGIGGILTQVEASETPTRSYILNLEHEPKPETELAEKQMRSEVIDSVLDSIVK